MVWSTTLLQQLLANVISCEDLGDNAKAYKISWGAVGGARLGSRGWKWPDSGWVALPCKDQVCNLGSTWIQPFWTKKLVVVALGSGGGAFHHLSLVHHLCSFLEKSGLVIVTHELVTSRFDYCDAIYGGLPLERVWEFQLVQNGVSQYTETRNSSIKGVALAPYSFPSKGSD